MTRIEKVISVIERNIIKALSVVSNKLYMKYYVKYLRKIGINIQGNPNFISTSVYFDGADYSKITIGENVTISLDVMFLTHDGSMHTIYKGLDIKTKRKLDKRTYKTIL